MQTTSFLNRRFQLFSLFIMTAAAMLLCPDAMAQSSSAPVVNRFARFVAGLLPPDVVIPILAFALIVCALTWWGGKMEGKTFLIIIIAGVLAGSATWWAQQAVSLGAG